MLSGMRLSRVSLAIAVVVPALSIATAADASATLSKLQLNHALLTKSQISWSYDRSNADRRADGLAFCNRRPVLSYDHWAGRFSYDYFGHTGVDEKLYSFAGDGAARHAWLHTLRTAEACDHYYFNPSKVGNTADEITINSVITARHPGNETFTVRFTRHNKGGRTYRDLLVLTREGSVVIQTTKVSAGRVGPYRPSVLKLARKADLKVLEQLD